jgi:hypothetical protein
VSKNEPRVTPRWENRLQPDAEARRVLPDLRNVREVKLGPVRVYAIVLIEITHCAAIGEVNQLRRRSVKLVALNTQAVVPTAMHRVSEPSKSRVQLLAAEGVGGFSKVGIDESGT